MDEIVYTSYGQFDLLWPVQITQDMIDADDWDDDLFDEDDFIGFVGDFDPFFEGQVNGLAGAADPRGLYMPLARTSGGSPVSIVVTDAAPADDPQWEDVVEVSVTIRPGSKPAWSSWCGESGGPLDLEPGTYRVRVSARGRDAAHADEFAEGHLDFYLLEFWPADPQPDAIVRTQSESATRAHRSLGGRR